MILDSIPTRSCYGNSSIFLGPPLLLDKFSFHDILPVAPAIGAKPLALWFVGQVDATEMEPFYVTVIVVTSDHLSIGNLEKMKQCILVKY